MCTPFPCFSGFLAYVAAILGCRGCTSVGKSSSGDSNGARAFWTTLFRHHANELADWDMGCKDSLFLVTGATGYFGSHCVKHLLDKGYRVRGTVRSLQNKETNLNLLSLLNQEAAKDHLELAEAQLENADSWIEAVKDCDYVVHVAAPFPSPTASLSQRTKKEVIDGCVEGTLNVLKACAHQPRPRKLKRVVLTSSALALLSSEAIANGKPLDEECWADENEDGIHCYKRGKILAEKAAWDFMRTLPDESRFEISVINPGLLLGPVLLPGLSQSTSVKFMTNLLTSTADFAFGLADFDVYFCDVRDAAAAAHRASVAKGAAGNRHALVSSEVPCSTLKDVADAVASEFEPLGYRVQRRMLPRWLAAVYAAFDKNFRDHVYASIGQRVSWDNTRMRRCLGIQPIPKEKTFSDMCHSLVKLGYVRETKEYKRQFGSPDNENFDEK